MPRDAPPPAPPTRDVDVERDVVTALRRDGTLDALRASTLDALRRDETMKTFTEFAVRGSHALRDPRARLRTRTELVDALFHELEGRVLDEARARTWDALTDASTGVGRSLYERSYVAASEARAGGREREGRVSAREWCKSTSGSGTSRRCCAIMIRNVATRRARNSARRDTKTLETLERRPTRRCRRRAPTMPRRLDACT